MSREGGKLSFFFWGGGGLGAKYMLHAKKKFRQQTVFRSDHLLLRFPIRIRYNLILIWICFRILPLLQHYYRIKLIC